MPPTPEEHLQIAEQAVQHAPVALPFVAMMVERLRELGARKVESTSWIGQLLVGAGSAVLAAGATLFLALPAHNAAAEAHLAALDAALARTEHWISAQAKDNKDFQAEMRRTVEALVSHAQETENASRERDGTIKDAVATVSDRVSRLEGAHRLVERDPYIERRMQGINSRGKP